MSVVDVSVVIPTYNRLGQTMRAVESVALQTVLPKELIVVDDGSTQSMELLKQQINKIPFARYLKIEKNSGVSVARNFGIELATSQCLAFLDSDDYWLPEKLEKQYSYMIEYNYLISQTEEFWYRDQRFVNQSNKYRKPQGDIFEESVSLCAISPSAGVVFKTLFF